MTSILAFATLVLVLLLILVNTKTKEKFTSIDICSAPPPSSSNVYLVDKYPSLLNNQNRGYATYLDPGYMEMTVNGSSLCTACNAANFVVMPNTLMVSLGNNATCTRIGMKPVSQFSTDNSIRINGAVPSQTLVNQGLSIKANNNDCYAVINNSDDASRLINTLRDNDSDITRWTNLIANLDSILATTRQNTSNLNSQTATTSQNTSNTNAATAQITTANNGIRTTNNILAVSIQNQEIINNNLLQQSNQLASQAANMFISAEMRAARIASTQNILIQKKHNGRYFSLMYKYSSEGGADPAVLWDQKIDVNKHLFNTNNNIKDNIRSLNVNYRNNELMNIVFGSQSPESHILVEIYRFDANRNGGRIAWMLFNKPYSSNDDFYGWFSGANYIEGHFRREVIQQSMQFFSIAGDSRLKRRFFLNLFYNGCGGDPSLMVLPYVGQDSCWWDNAFKGQIVLAKDLPVNLGGATVGSTPGINSDNAIIGNVMMIWKCRAPPATDEHVAGATNVEPIT